MYKKLLLTYAADHLDSKKVGLLAQLYLSKKLELTEFEFKTVSMHEMHKTMGYPRRNSSVNLDYLYELSYIHLRYSTEEQGVRHTSMIQLLSSEEIMKFLDKG